MNWNFFFIMLLFYKDLKVYYLFVLGDGEGGRLYVLLR